MTALVFATDFSEGAARAASSAALLAARRNAKLSLVHAVPANTLHRLGEPFREATERALREEADRLSALGAEVDIQLLSGSLDEAVMAHAKRVQALAILVGPPSGPPTLTGVGGSLDRLSARSDRPLLVLRQPERFSSWAQGDRPLRILVGLDRSVASEAALRFAHLLGTLGPVQLEIGHVFYPSEESARLGLPRPTAFDEVTQDLREALERELGARTRRPDGSHPPVHLRVGLGRKADHLTELARELDADLLLVGNHHPRALAKLWSVSHHVMRTAACAVATVPAGSVEVEGQAGSTLPTFQTVTVATDFSPLGNRAVPHAFAAAAPGATIHIIHAAEGVESPEMTRGLQERLLELVPNEARLKGQRALPEVLAPRAEQDLATTIIQAAARHGSDLVVLGSHGRTGLEKFLLGSVARGVMEATDRPVLIVRAPPR